MKIIAHRGARAYAPENTMAAFKLAHEMGADGIEMDIHLSLDGEIIICHDDLVDRTSNGSGLLKDMSVAQLKQLDFGAWHSAQFANERILTFIEFWLWFRELRPSFIVNVEIKNGPYIHVGIEQALLDIFSAHPVDNLYDRVIISSFHHPTLLHVKQLDKKMKTAPLFGCCPVDVVAFCRDSGGAEYIHPDKHSIQPEMVNACRAAGIGINVWTVNNVDDFEYIATYQPDGIITDYPDRGLPYKHNYLLIKAKR